MKFTHPCIIVPVFDSEVLHYKNRTLISLVIIHEDKSYDVINIAHPDTPITDVDISQMSVHPKSLVLNKKALLHLGLDFGIDLESYILYYVDTHIPQEQFRPKVMEHIISRKYKHTGNIVPLSKWIEFSLNMASTILKYYRPELIDDKCIKFCEDYSNAFYRIEQTDVLIGAEYHPQNYWWYTATSRPSNSWNTLNFNSLSKKDGVRDTIKSRFDGGKIVQFDYDAFHLKLLSNILEYKFDTHPYVEISKMLGDKYTYDEVKTRVFQNIYGGITDEFFKHELFKRIQAMIDELYSQYKEFGKIESWFYGKRFRDIESPTPNKVFNYFLQSLETEYNVLNMHSIFKHMDGMQSKFMLYMWDAFVFDMHPGELHLIDEFKEMFEINDMTVKTSIGDTFGSLTII